MISLEAVLTALGVVVPSTGAGIKAFFSLRDRVAKVEAAQNAASEIVLVKLDAIAEKIDIRCDNLEHRLDRVERKVLNGDYHREDHR